MKSYSLQTGVNVIEIEDVDSPQFLFFTDVHKDTTIKAEIQSLSSDNKKLMPVMLLATVHEAQQKIEQLVRGSSIVPLVKTVGPYDMMVVQLALGGEVSLGLNEKVVVTIETGNSDIKMFVKGGETTTQTYYSFTQRNYEGKFEEQRLDVSTSDFLIFENDTDKIPEEISRFYANQIKRDSANDVLLEQRGLFGIVGYETTADTDGGENVSLLQGSSKAVVVDVRGLTTLLLKDEREEDYKFYSVKF
jgi:hypothetical protein